VVAAPVHLRIGIRSGRTPGDLVSVDPSCTSAADDVAALVERDLGHHVEIAAPAALDELELLTNFLTIMGAATARDVDRLAATAGRAITPEDVEPYTWAQSEIGRAIPAADYLAATEGISAWTRRMVRWWEPDGGGGGNFDLLLTPTMAAPPAAIGEVRGDDANLAGVAAIPYAAFTLPFNITGQPAISLPLAWHDGLPIGVQLVAAPGREDVLLRVAAQLESASPWADRHP
jgi:amidase